MFFTPLKMERYYDAAEEIVNRLQEDHNKWSELVPETYRQNILQRFLNWLLPKFISDFEPLNSAEKQQRKFFSFASKAYRRLIKTEEKELFIRLFSSVYYENSEEPDPQRFNTSVAEVFKAILISPSFFIRWKKSL